MPILENPILQMAGFSPVRRTAIYWANQAGSASMNETQNKAKTIAFR
jgi:hypothetical protein